jgi:hypothetical protein
VRSLLTATDTSDETKWRDHQLYRPRCGLAAADVQSAPAVPARPGIPAAKYDSSTRCSQGCCLGSQSAVCLGQEARRVRSAGSKMTGKGLVIRPVVPAVSVVWVT